MNIVEALNWRYAVKKFDSSKKISHEDWLILEEAIRLSPSSYGLQPWKIYVVTNQELKEELVTHSWNQEQVADCSHLVVIAFHEKMDEEHVDKNIELMAKTRGVALESLLPFGEVIKKDIVHGARSAIADHWAQKQCYILMGFLLFAAAQLKIDTCPMEGINPEKYDELLNVDGKFKTVAAVPLGYRAEDDKYAGLEKVRFDKNEVFEFIK